MNQKFKTHIQLIIKELNYPFIDVNVQTPKNMEHGDLTTNTSMIIGKKINKNPIEIAEKIINQLKQEHSEDYSNITIAGPGFINVKLSQKNLKDLLYEIKEYDYDYGKTNYGENKKAIVEFVSANPTGPLTVAHGRGAIIEMLLAEY